MEFGWAIIEIVLYIHSCHIVKKSFVCANHAAGLLVVCCPFAASNQTLLRVKVPAVRIKVCDNKFDKFTCFGTENKTRTRNTTDGTTSIL